MRISRAVVTGGAGFIGANLVDRLIDDGVDLRDLLIKTDIPKFSVLPAGRRHRRSTELLASNTMRHLLDELALLRDELD